MLCGKSSHRVLHSALAALVLALASETSGLSGYLGDVWQTEDGLPHNAVQAIVQTRDGYLWLGTPAGLVRFDGVRFRVFNQGELKHNNVHALVEDGDGTLWIGTYGGGLHRYQRGRFEAVGTSEGAASAFVRTLYRDRRGRLWVGTHDRGVAFRDGGGGLRTLRAADGLSNDTVRVVYEDRRDRIWIGTNAGGLNLWQDGRVSAYAVKPGPLSPYGAADGLSNDNVLALWEDGQGTLWIGTDGGGLWRLRDGRIEAQGTREVLGIDGVRQLLEDRSGRLWIGTDGGGLNLFRDGRFEAYTSRDGLPSDIVLALLEDRERNVWVGTRDGLLRLKSRKFRVYGGRDGLANDFVTAVLESADGKLWIGSRAGLDRFDPGSGRARRARPDLRDAVLSVLEDETGTVWIGTRSGLIRSGGATAREFRTADGLPSEYVTVLAPGRGGVIWVGTRRGLVQVEDGRVRPTPGGAGAPLEVTAALEQADGALWIGTETRGLFRLQAGAWRSWGTAEGLPHPTVTALTDDGESLWITTPSGLARWRDGRLRRYTTAEGLPSIQLFGAVDDRRGHLWLSTARGIARVEKRSFDEVDRGAATMLSVTSYGKTDGLRSSECNGAGQPAAWRGRDGRLWFATVKGLAVIDPARIPSNPEPPPVLIEEVRADDEPLPPEYAPELSPGHRRFEFHYTALSFFSPEKVRFRYKLEGFDRDWVEAGPRRVAYYTNVPAGAYRFRVTAANEDGVWNAEGAAYGFSLRAHFYRTRWFWAGCLAAAGLLGLGFYRLRMRQLTAQFAAVIAERSRIAREIHDTLAQSFVGIGVQLETVAKTLPASPELARAHLDRARILVRSSLAEARRSVWALRSQALETADLGGALAEVAQQLSGDTKVAVEVSGRRRRLPAEVETNLLRIGQEALANAVRHASAQQVRVELCYGDGRVRLTVRDDGRGFDVAQAGRAAAGHFGLAGIRERVHNLGGELSLLSGAGRGAEVVVEVPVA
jgi:ligand-binding sensor domain-containing protein/signal transduction histidine kinase